MSSSKANTTAPTRNSTKPPKEPKKSNVHARLKIIIRRLPPNLPEHIFWQSVQPWVTDETVSWKVFRPGKFRKTVGKENIPSVAYLSFKNEECLAAFSKEYDGHHFRDKQGNDSFAIVEFAPNPKVPPEKKKVDPRHATVQQDEDYLSFAASLQNPPEKHEVDMDTLLASTAPPEETKMTPLLAALLEQKEQKAVVQEKKILINEAKAARKAAAAAASAGDSSAVVAGGRKGRKGKGKDSGAPPLSAALTAGRGRNRGNQATSANKEKETIQPSAIESPPRKEKDKERERTRPVVGLGSRHLKAALSGAGVQLPATATATSSTTSAISMSVSASTATATTATVPSSSGPSALIQSPVTASTSTSTGGPEHSHPTGVPLPPPRGRGAGRGKRGQESKDGSTKEGSQVQGGRGGGGGGGGGREKKPRPPSSSGLSGSTADVPPPRILTRQDPHSVNTSGGGIQGQELGSSGSGRGNGGGGSRGRGGRRERLGPGA